GPRAPRYVPCPCRPACRNHWPRTVRRARRGVEPPAGADPSAARAVLPRRGDARRGGAATRLVTGNAQTSPRGRSERLRLRLARRGFSATAALAASLMSVAGTQAGVPSHLFRSALRLGRLCDDGEVPVALADLARDALRGLRLARLHGMTVVLLLLSVLG